jgi:pimeloyl-ACP methyl ester carboxylesterase
VTRLLQSEHLATLSFAAFPRVSLRDRPAGGSVISHARTTPADLLLRSDEVILLAHGYNNSQSVALASYKAFLQNVGDPLAGSAAGLFWPGDGITFRRTTRRSLWHSPLLSALSYPWQPQRAAEAAERLSEVMADAIRARSLVGRRPLTINVVAHSMGCQLTLELLKLLRVSMRAGQIVIRNLVLMAAAVPRYSVQEHGDLEMALRSAQRTRVFWSKSDRVLSLAFPLGQFLERPFPLGWRSRVAVGRTGISFSERVTAHETSHGHSDYWSDDRIARHVKNDMGGLYRVPRVRSRVLHARDERSRRLVLRKLAR